MKKIEVFKTGACVVVSFGVGVIVGNIVKGTTPSDVRKITKLCIAAGSLVLSNVAGDIAAKYTEKKIDEAVEFVTDAVDMCRASEPEGAEKEET